MRFTLEDFIPSYEFYIKLEILFLSKNDDFYRFSHSREAVYIKWFDFI